MKEILLRLRIVTPLYNQGEKDDVGLKIPSLRGVLRFWWRALQAENDIAKLKMEEQRIFGGVSGAAMASSVKLRIVREPDSDSTAFKNSSISMNAKYLALGIFEMGQNPDRLCIESGTYEVAFQYPEQFENDVKQTLLAFHYFGNLGAKARNGFGSLLLENFRELCNENNDTPEKFFKTIPKKQILPNYTAFCENSKLFLCNNIFANEKDALAKINEMYSGIRATMNNPHKPIEGKHDYSIRKYISYPIGPKVDEKHIFTDSKNARYSKPYFFKVYRKSAHEFQVFVLNLLHQYAYGIEHTDIKTDRSALANPNLQSEFENACSEFNKKLKAEHDFTEVK